MRMRPSGWGYAAILATLLFTATPPNAFPVQPSVSLEELAQTADLICKATAVADHPVTDDGFLAFHAYQVWETELRVVSIMKGTASSTIRFRHYGPLAGLLRYAQKGEMFAMGRTYVILAARGADGTYRQLTKSPGFPSRGVLLAADTKPLRGTTITEVAWADLVQLLKSPNDSDVVEAIDQLDLMSGGRLGDLGDFDRARAFTAIAPLLNAKSVAVATAAIAVFGQNSPYFDEEAVPHWLEGIRKGASPGFAPRKTPTSPPPDIAITGLLHVATDGETPQLRGLAIRAVAPYHAISAAMLSGWLRNPSTAVRQAAALASAELPARQPIKTASTDPSPEVRHAAALAVGLTQDASLLPLLDKLLDDADATNRSAAALSLLAFPIDQSATVMKAHLASDFRPLFVNALARVDPQPYLATLIEGIEHQWQQPDNWLGGVIPYADSWQILFDHVKSLPAADLTSGKLDRSLDALEGIHWFSSQEPRDLYALYVRRGLVARAKQFRAKTHNNPFDMEEDFNRVDRNPAIYIP